MLSLLARIGIRKVRQTMIWISTYYIGQNREAFKPYILWHCNFGDAGITSFPVVVGVLVWLFFFTVTSRHCPEEIPSPTPHCTCECSFALACFLVHLESTLISYPCWVMDPVIWKIKMKNKTLPSMWVPYQLYLEGAHRSKFRICWDQRPLLPGHLV